MHSIAPRQRQILLEQEDEPALQGEDPIITVLRLVDEIEGDDPDELVRRFKRLHPALDRQDFLDACTVALDIIDSRPKHLH